MKITVLDAATLGDDLSLAPLSELGDGGVVLLTDHVGNTGSHGNGGDTGGADEGVDLAAGQLVHDLAAQQTAGGGDAEGHDAQHDDGQGLSSQEGGAHHGGADRQGQQDGDDVHQGILHGVGQTVGAVC